MFDMSMIYRPITAFPFRNGKEYRELPPSLRLRPYIRCYWESMPYCKDNKNSLVIPDTCTDIIFTFGSSGEISDSCYCCMDELPYRASINGAVSFGIRFYPWSGCLFSGNSFKGMRNCIYDPDDVFEGLRQELSPLFTQGQTLEERAVLTEKCLLKRLRFRKSTEDFLNTVYEIISSRGNIKACTEFGSPSGRKHLQRLFAENMGISPKSFSSLVRYQLLWKDMLFDQNFTIMDGVEKYGYFDESHLLNDFHKRHSTSPTEALKLAVL